MASTVAAPSSAARNKIALAVESWPIERVRPYPQNPRRNEAAVAKVAASLREFGFRQPIVVDTDGVVIAGHTRLKAAQSLGLEAVPVHVADELNADQIRAYRLADNRTAEEAEWDVPMLTGELGELKAADFDLSVIGFDADELAAMFTEPSAVLDGADLDAVPEPPAEPITKLGDRIVLGRHTLVCGDSTDAGAWDALLAGRQVGMVWSDPPYGVALNVGLSPEEARRLRKRTDGKVIENDALDEQALEDLLQSALGLAWANSRSGAAWYIAAPAGPLFLPFAKVLSALEVWRQTLVWAKDVFVMGRSDYHYRHEAIFYGWKEGAAHTWASDRKQHTLLEFDRPKRNAEHPTMKPVALVRYCIENSSKADDLVMDPFGGSGTTLLAAESCGRSAALIELSPAYCDVIVKRWEDATGLKAERPQ